MKWNVYWDEITEQFWISNGIVLYSEFFNEIQVFPVTDIFFSDEIIYLGEL